MMTISHKPTVNQSIYGPGHVKFNQGFVYLLSENRNNYEMYIHRATKRIGLHFLV